jgi:hypothetical protein
MLRRSEVEGRMRLVYELWRCLLRRAGKLEEGGAVSATATATATVMGTLCFLIGNRRKVREKKRK